MLQTPPRECYFLLPHPEKASILMLQGPDGWSLPHCSLPAHSALFYSQLLFTQEGLIWERSTVAPNQLRALLKRRAALFPGTH